MEQSNGVATEIRNCESAEDFARVYDKYLLQIAGSVDLQRLFHAHKKAVLISTTNK